MSTLSICMIVKNEEVNLPRLFKSIRNLADEIIVVDTGSKDSTPQLIQKEPNTKLITAPWENDFAKARNISLSHATGDWILILDADETMTEHVLIRELISESKHDAFQLRIKNLQPQNNLTKFEEAYVTRLFKNKPEYRFTGRIHEQISPSILQRNQSIGVSTVTITHHGYANDKVQGDGSRSKRNLLLLEQELTANPTDYYYLYQMGLAQKTLNPELSKKYLLLALEHGQTQGLPNEIGSQIHLRLAQIHLEQFNHNQTLHHAKKSIHLNPNNIIARVCLVTAQISVQDFLQAIPHLQYLIQHGKESLSNHSDFELMMMLCQQQIVQQNT